MIPVALHLKNKNVLVVGGGKVALSRVQRYLEEEANIIVVSPSFLEEFHTLPVKCIQDSYKKEYLKDIFFVYSATQYKEINHQVLQDCNDCNILCGSATKDDSASFYGMPHRQNEVGMVAYSSHQQFPYASPILDELMNVVEMKKEKLTLLAKLRPYVIKTKDYHKSIFQKLYDASEEFLTFLLQSIEHNQGTIVIYHQNRFDNNYYFDIHPHISLSIEEFQNLKDLLIFDVQYTIVPLVLSNGRIYHQMVDGIKDSINNIGPVIQSKQDAIDLLQLLKQGNDLFIMHDRKNSDLKKIFQEANLGLVYDFKDEIILEKDKEYNMTVLLFGKGRHYVDLLEYVEKMNQEGYHINFIGNLLQQNSFYQYLMNRITK